MATLRIKEICKEQGITLADLAVRLNITASALSQSIKRPSFDTLERVSTALNVEVVDLFEKCGDFIAFVRKDGETHTFTKEQELKEFAEKLF